MIHLRFAWFLLRHKLWVFVAGTRLRVPWPALLRHDLSKCQPHEWRNHALAYAGLLDADKLRRLTTEHAQLERHHWEHWGGREMPDSAAREMVADWMGRGRVRTGRWDVADWYAENSARIELHPATRQAVEALLTELTTSARGAQPRSSTRRGE